MPDMLAKLYELPELPDFVPGVYRGLLDSSSL